MIDVICLGSVVLEGIILDPATQSWELPTATCNKRMSPLSCMEVLPPPPRNRDADL